MEEFDKKEVMMAFEALAARLDSLDGMWDKEIELVRKALEEVGYA